MEGRRSLKTRSAAWAGALARATARSGLTPNVISFLSVIFAVLGAGCLVLVPHMAEPLWRCLLYVGAIAGIQGRLLCNMLDGMVAVEGGKGTPSGPLWNEVPDRIADVVIILAVGVIAEGAGWPYGFYGAIACACLAMLTAYIRALSAASGCADLFHGPMAKPHRMAMLSAACLAASIASFWAIDAWFMWGVLALMLPLLVITCWRRLAVASRQLHERAQAAS